MWSKMQRIDRNRELNWGLLGKLELPLLVMLFDLIMSLARLRTCWCWAKRWSWLLPSCCGVCGATIKNTQAFVSFSRLHKRATSFAARYHLKIATLTLARCSLRSNSIGKVLIDALPHFTPYDRATQLPVSSILCILDNIKWPMARSFVTVP